MFRSVLVAASAVCTTACAPRATTIADVAVGNADFTELVRAVIRLDLVATLDDRDASFTVFAPTDAAFEGVDVDALPDDVLASVVTYHVVGGQALGTADLPPVLPSISQNAWGQPMVLLTDGAAPSVNGAAIVLPDVVTDNGVIHAVGSLLLPPNVGAMAGIAGASRFLELVEASAPLSDGTTLAEALAGPGPLTVLVPSNEALAAEADVIDGLDANQLSVLLTHHVFFGNQPLTADDLGAGARTMLSGEEEVLTVVPSVADLHAANGVVHVIDEVLLPASLR